MKYIFHERQVRDVPNLPAEKSMALKINQSQAVSFFSVSYYNRSKSNQ